MRYAIWAVAACQLLAAGMNLHTAGKMTAVGKHKAARQVIGSTFLSLAMAAVTLIAGFEL